MKFSAVILAAAAIAAVSAAPVAVEERGWGVASGLSEKAPSGKRSVSDVSCLHA